jgi:WD40 repeat protein
LSATAHALRVTWEQRDGRTLTVEGYRASGGVASAIAQTADSVVEAVSLDRRGLMRNVFLRLTELGEGVEDTRRRVAVEELVPEGASPEEVQALLDRLADARLVTLGEGTAEVAHEVLIREWPTLRAWLEEDRAGIRLHRQLGDAARLWAGGGREAGDLYRGTRLAAAVEWAQAHPEALNATERAFLDASVAESERERRTQLRANRRLRMLLGGVGLLLAAAVIAGVLALRESDRSRDSARTADAQRLGAQALIDDRLDRSLLLAQAGRELNDSVATRGNLLSALVRHPAAVGVIQGETKGVYELALSPDGRVLAAGDGTGTIVLVDTRTRESIGRLELDRAIFGLDFSPDGELLLVASAPFGAPLDDHGVKLVDLATTKVVREFDVGRYPPEPPKRIDARFSEDGRAVIATVTSDVPDVSFPSRVRRYDVRTGRPLGPVVRIGQRDSLLAQPVPGRRDRMLFVGADETFVLDASTLRVLRRLPVGAFSAGLSPDGRRAALGGEDGSVAILDLRTGERRTLSGRHEDRVHGLVFMPDGRTLVSRSDDGKVLVWDLPSSQVRETLTGHTGPIPSVVVSDDGRTLYTGGLDQRVIFWDIAGDRRLARPFQAHPFRPSGGLGADYPPALAISPSGRIVAAGSPDGRVRLHDARTLRRLRDLSGIEGGAAWVVEFSPDGRAVAVTGEGGSVELRDAATGRRLRPTLRGLGPPAQAMGFSPDGGRLAVADHDGTLRLVGPGTGTVRRGPRLPGSPVSLSFSPDGKTLAIALDAGGTELRDGRSLRLIARPRNRSGDPDSWASFSPDGRVLAIASVDGYTQLWDVADRKPIGAPLRGHEDLVANAEFSPDGRLLATSGFDGTVILWDVESRRALGTLPGPLGFTSARFTPDGRRLFVLRNTGAAQRWEVSPDAWSRHACDVAGRELTRAEWEEFVPDQDYRRVCSP